MISLFVYDSERVRWWAGRSRSPEYQTAYGVIAKYVYRERPQVVLDVGCGPGEMMKRLYEGTRLLVGTDATPEILDMAYENLKSAGASPRMGNASEIRMEYSGAVLVRDDILNSCMPDNFSDVSVMTFLEVGTEADRPYIDPVIVEKFIRRYGPLRLGEADMKGFLGGLAEFHHLSRLTRPGGALITAEYDVSDGKDADARRFDGNGEMAEFMFDMKPESMRFYPSQKIWEDTNEELRAGCGGMKGYRVFKSIKLSRAAISR